MGLSWMAWTWPTAAFFLFVVLAIATMGFLEYRSPGGAPRRGILGLDTTRGDRLFISLLGSAFIFLRGSGLYGTPLWGGHLPLPSPGLSLSFARREFTPRRVRTECASPFPGDGAGFGALTFSGRLWQWRNSA